jgi:hypothetical protein
MADRSATVLRRIAAELQAELSRIDRTVVEVDVALQGVSNERVKLYATAALLDTFYTGVEKAFRRIAAELGGVPEGPGWHRTLLEDMGFDIPKVRPSVLRPETTRGLARFLAFRHRFRNLYLFDLEPEPVASLVRDLARTWAEVRADLEGFAATIERLADELD